MKLKKAETGLTKAEPGWPMADPHAHNKQLALQKVKR